MSAGTPGVGMSFRFASVVFAAVMLFAAGAPALTIEEVGAPAEQPPAGFSGTQYVDSRGCVFMRAGLDGQTAWVPRIDSNRQVICDRPPTFGAPLALPAVAATGAAAETEAVAEAPPAAAPPSAPAPAVRRAPVREAAAARTSGRRIGCFASVPVPVRVRLADGGTAVLCTRGDGTLDGARVPLYPAGEGPDRWVAAPGQLVAVTRSSAADGSGAGAPPRDRHYVQVGAFRVSGNAVRAREALRAMGLPTARAEAQGLTMVLAGPFASIDEAYTARGAARGAGFDDAFIR